MMGSSTSVLVVGSGPAGCLVARRLCDAGHEVTLLEAGAGYPRPSSIAGPDWFGAIEEPGWSWPGLSVRQVAGGPLIPYLRGRGLGGSSSINAMIAMSGPVEDLDRFASSGAQLRVLGDLPLSVSELGPVADALAARVEVAPASLLLKDGQRQSAFEIYLAGYEDRVNILTHARVHRLLVTSGRRVVGVELGDAAQPDTAQSDTARSGEVIFAEHVVLCAGAIHSPALLLNSEVINPYVGVGLQDHPAVSFTLKLRDPGPVGSAAATGTATWSSAQSGGEHDLQVLALEHLGADNPDVEPGVSLYGSVTLALMQAQSEGTVSIDDAGAPVVDFNLLSARIDRVRLRSGVRRLVALMSDGLFDGVASDVLIGEDGASLDSVPLGSLVDQATSDERLDDWIRDHLGTYVHAAASCRLGSCVGRAGEVRGWQGVSVIDASALPFVPRANTQIPTLMLAESLVADLVELLKAAQ